MSLQDLSGVVDDLCDVTLTVTRSGPSTYTTGRLNAPSTSTITINASVQPIGGRDLQRLPEGSRVSDSRTLYTTTELKTSGAGQSPDLVAIDGESYEVHTVENWASVASVYKVLVSKTGN